MAVVYSVINQKGGVGKTTTAVNVAAEAALAGWRVLLADLDPQANATSGLGCARARGRITVYQSLIGETPLREALAETDVPGLSLVPSDLELAGAELELAGRLSRELCLRELLAEVRNDFDLILIDTPPSLGLLTVNALAASDALIVPIQCEYYALEGVSQLIRTIDLVRRRLHPSLEIAMALPTMADSRARLSADVLAEIRRVFGEKVSATVVPRNVRLSEAPSHGKPVALYDARSRGARAYKAVAGEVMLDAKARSGKRT